MQGYADARTNTMMVGKNETVVVFVLTGFGDAGTSSEIRGLELRPELTPRAFCFSASWKRLPP
jgi:hypothetical protein